MSQVSYGTITITDTNDIERIYMVYAGSSSDTAAPDASNFNLWKADITQVSGDYIWQRTVVKKSGITITSSNFQEYYGDPVCITGPEGAPGEPARKITKVTPYYCLSMSSSDPKDGSWSDTPATYPSTGTYYYWTKTVTTYDSGSPTESTPVLDKALNSANKAARDANQTASATQINLNNYIVSNDAALDALQTKTKYFWTNLIAHTNGNDGWTKPNYLVGTYAASGIDNITFDTEDSSTYGYNTLYANGIKLRYNAIDLGQLTGSSLIFYNPSTTSQGKKAMELSGSVLKFYASDGATAQAEFGGTKARVSGTIEALGGQIGGWNIGTDTNKSLYTGTFNSNGGIYISPSYSGVLDVAGTTSQNWAFTAGNAFGVTTNGNLYANEAHINGEITATSLTIESKAPVSGLSTSNIDGMNNYALQENLDSEITQRKAIYAVSTTEATIPEKTTESGTPPGFVLYNGATVTVKFDNGNSTTTPTLNVNGTGAKTIKSYTGAALTEAEYTWPAGVTITFTYDGSYWRMQDSGALQAKATDQHFWVNDKGVHITKTPRNGTVTGGNTLITGEGMEVRDGNKTLASFKGDSINIGTQDATRLKIGASALEMYVLGAKVFDMSGAGLTIGLSVGGYSSLDTRKLVVGGELFDKIFRTMQVYSGDKLEHSTGITVNAGESVNVNCRLPYAVKSVDDIEGLTGITEVHELTGLVSSHGWSASVSSDGYSVKLSGTVPATTDDGTAANDLVLHLTGITPAASSVSETYGGGYAEFRDSIKAGGWIEASTMQAEKIALNGDDITNLFSGRIYVGFADKSLSIAAGGNTGESTINLSKSGYSARCICGWNLSGTGSSNCVMPKLFIDYTKQEIHYYVKNTGNSKATPTLRIYILYTKNN